MQRDAATFDPERRASEFLFAALDPVSIGGEVALDEPYEYLLGFLEAFVTWVLCEAHGWGDSIDGIFPRKVVKTADREVLLVGKCILVTDQSEAPIYLKIGVTADGREIDWLECGLASPEVRGSRRADALEERACENLQDIAWTVRAQYGV